MKDIVFSVNPVDELNEMVQRKVAPHLFLCCHYSILPVSGLSDDAKYFRAIDNLYNFAFDSNCIIKKFKNDSFIDNVDLTKRDELKRIMSEIELLRSIHSHNNSPDNGRIEAERLLKYHELIKKHINKDNPDCREDYSILLSYLLSLGDSLFSILSIFINAASTNQQKERIINDWENYTIDWYCGKNVKRDIFLGQLQDAYLAKAQITRIPSNIEYKVAWWIHNYYLSPYSIVRTELNRKAIDITIGPEKRKQCITELQKLTEDIGKLYNETEEKYGKPPFGFQDKLFSDLPKLLQETLTKKKCSMLPEDLLQQQIDSLFSDVPTEIIRIRDDN